MALLSDVKVTAPLPKELHGAAIAKWREHELAPATGETAASISGGKDPNCYSNFCPEVAYDTFKLFASTLIRINDSIDRQITERLIEKDPAPEGTLRVWNWTPDCGWVENNDPAEGLSSGCGFGERRHADDLAQEIAQLTNGQEMEWSNVTQTLNELKEIVAGITPKQLVMLSEMWSILFHAMSSARLGSVWNDVSLLREGKCSKSCLC